MMIINKTLQKLVSVKDDVTDDDEVTDDVSMNLCNESVDENACLHMINDKDKYKFFLQYRGKETDTFVNV